MCCCMNKRCVKHLVTLKLKAYHLCYFLKKKKKRNEKKYKVHRIDLVLFRGLCFVKSVALTSISDIGFLHIIHLWYWENIINSVQWADPFTESLVDLWWWWWWWCCGHYMVENHVTTIFLNYNVFKQYSLVEWEI